ncbi:TPA: plasmid transfer protein [Escherichia coli]|nr:plasmid transfer protein [Escherichia coli]EFB2841808.1 plasmid transfer protein [Escherichia coli]HAI1526501.1 plasmid transfer protein [Escherichia coli]
MAMKELEATGKKVQRVRVFSQSVAMAIEANLDKSRSSDNSAFISEAEKYYLTLQFAPPANNREFGWNSEGSILMKLSQNETMALASVFLRIKPTFKLEKRKTTHRTHPAYKNINIGPNDRGGLLVTAGIVPVERGAFKPLNYNLPVTQMDCVSTGLFLLGFLTLKMPYVSSESIITALRLSESKSGQ